MKRYVIGSPHAPVYLKTAAYSGSDPVKLAISVTHSQVLAQRFTWDELHRFLPELMKVNPLAEALNLVGIPVNDDGDPIQDDLAHDQTSH